MIEKVYSGKEQSDSNEVRVPKNIKQIGGNTSHKKIYIEDYVMNYLKKKTQKEEYTKYGVLVGEVKKGKGNTYVFIKGLIEVKEVIENSLIFNDEIWSDIYKNIKNYFHKDSIVGWYVSVPYRVNDDMKGIRKLHLDNFAGNNKVCFLSDRTEKEDGFYFYQQGNLKKQDGYYIYYEKNDNMKKYVKSMEEKEQKEEKLKEVIRRKPEQKNQKEKIVYAKENNETKNKRDFVPKTFREIFNEGIEARKKEEENRKNKNKEKAEETFSMKKMKGRFSYALSGLLIVALLLSTVVMLNNYGELKTIKSSLSNINNNKSAQAVNEILEEYNETTSISESTTLGTTSESAKEVTSQANNQEATKIQNPTVENQSKPQNQSKKNKKVSKSVSSMHSGEALTVKKGQTLYDISVRYYGTSKMVDEIKELNDIDNDYTIVEGQRILLP